MALRVRPRMESATAHVKYHDSWCPECARGRWKREELCRDIIEHLTGCSFPPKRPDFLGRLELDGYSEELSVAFEHQGVQHYKYVPFFHGRGMDAFREGQQRDERKRRLCCQNGVVLIEIPYTETDIEGFIASELKRFGVPLRPS
eukprot:NODE_503_length_1518_cov_296.691729.p1 GENE.NODE_503_length_1518_cov_296.691729~~NODE_503_length_1518_cov_296.691729.p1  ORF type:complete len:145 (+),score=18.32 NODE_503_length_1518_cov_296.691729:237-671(+)